MCPLKVWALEGVDKMMPNMRPYIIKPNNVGTVAGTNIVTTTAGNDLLHTLPVATVAGVTAARSAVITKIMAYNPNGANVTLAIGTLNRAGAPAFVQLLPTLIAIGVMDNEWEEVNIPAVEFMSWPQLTAAGRTGDIYVLASLAGVLITLELREFGG